MFELLPTPLRDCVEVQCNTHWDERGSLTKTWQAPMFDRLGLPKAFAEQFVSTSRRGVIRGLHCQYPPHACSKLVYCVSGEVMDVVVDIRRNSPTYGKHYKTLLTVERANMLYVPQGFVHGFCVLSDSATLVYNATHVHVSGSDGGILWNSAGIVWPEQRPIISPRDSALIPLKAFVTPFIY